MRIYRVRFKTEVMASYRGGHGGNLVVFARMLTLPAMLLMQHHPNDICISLLYIAPREGLGERLCAGERSIPFSYFIDR